MSSLKELQEKFQNFVLEDDREFANDVQDLDKAPAESGLNVYQNGYYLRLLEVLEIDYPMLRKILGDDTFYAWGRAYIKAYPSHRFSVRHFGENFYKFLKDYPQAEPFHSEMALFEWYLEDCMDAEDAPHLTIEELSKIPPENWIEISFTLHPSVASLPLYYNVGIIWSAHNEDADIPELQLSEDPIHWLFWRFERRGFYQSLNENQFIMFKALKEGKSFGEICEELCENLQPEEVAQFAGVTLSNWIADGIISRVD